MKTTKDLGKLIKRKYPEYSDMTDEEVGLRVRRKYPEYSDFIHVSRNSQKLLDYYDPKLGRLRSWWRRLKSEGRNKLQAQLTPELASILEQGAMLEDAALNNQRKQAEFQAYIITNEFLFNELHQKFLLLLQATEQGMTVETLQTIHLQGQQSENYIKEQQAATTDQIRMAQAISEIKLREFSELESTKLNNELRKMNEQVRLALIAKALSSHQRVILVQELLDGLYKQIEDIEHTPLKPETRRRMIEDREEIISHFKGYRNAEGHRLLEADT